MPGNAVAPEKPHGYYFSKLVLADSAIEALDKEPDSVSSRISEFFDKELLNILESIPDKKTGPLVCFVYCCYNNLYYCSAFMHPILTPYIRSQELAIRCSRMLEENLTEHEMAKVIDNLLKNAIQNYLPN